MKQYSKHNLFTRKSNVFTMGFSKWYIFIHNWYFGTEVIIFYRAAIWKRLWGLTIVSLNHFWGSNGLIHIYVFENSISSPNKLISKWFVSITNWNCRTKVRISYMASTSRWLSCLTRVWMNHFWWSHPQIHIYFSDNSPPCPICFRNALIASKINILVPKWWVSRRPPHGKGYDA